MQIAKIEAIPYTIPYSTPLHFASGAVHEANHVLVRIETSDGVVGWADTPPRPYTYGETQKSIVAVVEDIFAPQLEGLSVFDREKAQAVMARTIHNETAKGAVDIALWDCIGKILGRPVTELLGGFSDHMRVSHMLGFKPAQELLDLALEFRETYGIDTFKLKTGRRPLSLDVEAARVLREGLGEDTEIYMDSNRGWSANEAAEVLRRTADLGLSFLEEPDDAREVLGRRRLVEKSAIPIAAELLRRGAVVAAYDPVAKETARAALPAGVTHADSLAQVLEGADAALLLTRWAEFRALPETLAGMARAPLLVDGRRIVEPSAVARYEGIGR